MEVCALINAPLKICVADHCTRAHVHGGVFFFVSFSCAEGQG